MRETRESARMISCLRITLKGILPLATLAELVDAGLCPTPQQGARPPALPAKGASPPRAARHPTLAVGQRGRRSPAPIGIAYGAGDATGARGFALRAPYPRGRCPCGTARTPFRCIFHPKTPLFFVKGTLIDGLSPSV